MLKVTDLCVSIGEKRLLSEVGFCLQRGELIAVVGPNGSGKSSLAYSLMGHPDYQITKGEIEIDGERVTNKTTDERAKKGLFLAFQHPVEVGGVSVRQLLLAAVRQGGRQVDVPALKKAIDTAACELGIGEEMLRRGINSNFSGGEKKKMELLQIRVLKPKYAILDETDSGLDIDSVRVLGMQIKKMIEEKEVGMLLITHNNGLLKELSPRRVVVLKKGSVAGVGGEEVVEQLNRNGYQKLKVIK